MSRHELIRYAPNGHRPTVLEWLKRSLTLGPFSLKDKKLAEVMREYSGTTTLAGVSINEYSALSSSAVWSAVTMISDDIASLPLHLYRYLPNGGKDRFERHPLYELLHDTPNPEMDSMVWRRTMQTHLCLWQNAYAEIERNSANRPIAIWPLAPERVSKIRERGVIRYKVSNPETGGDVYIPDEDMIHLVGVSHDGIIGSSLIARARESLALTVAAERYGESFFRNGSIIGGTISYPGPKPPELSERAYLEKIEARHQGVERAYKMLALYNGAKYEPGGGVTPNEGQFVEARVFQIREVARWFKMPPHKLGDLADATYSNVEEMDAAYYGSCLRPYLKLWEQQLAHKLISPLERNQQFIEHDTHGFLSVDAASRAALYQAEGRLGTVTVNEMRGYENRDPIPGGDESFIAADLMPLSKVSDYWDARIAEIEMKAKPPVAPVVAPPPQQEPADQTASRAAVAALAAEVARLSEALGRAEEVSRHVTQQNEDLSSVNVELERRIDEALDGMSHEIERRAGAEDALVVEQADRGRDRTEWDAEKARIEALREEDTRAFVKAVEELEAVRVEKADLVAAMKAEQTERAVESAAWLAAREDYELKQEQDAADVLRASNEIETLRAELISAHDVLTDSGTLAQELQSARDTLSGELTQLRESFDHAQAEHATALEAIGAEAMASHAATMAELVAERANHATTVERAATAEADLDALKNEFNLSQRAYEVSLAASRAEHATAIAAMTAERDTAITRAEDDTKTWAATAEMLQAEKVVMEADLIALTEATDEARKARDAAVFAHERADATAAEAVLRAETAERDAATAMAAQQAALEHARQAREEASDLRTRMLAANRAVLVDAMNRIVGREAERAKRQSATPDKLRAWMRDFYLLYEETAVDILRAPIRAHLALMASDENPGTVTLDLVQAHIAESVRQLEAVAASEASEFHLVLNKTLARWESQRPDAFADTLLQQGVDHATRNAHGG